MEVPFHKKLGYLVPMDKNINNNIYIYIYIYKQKGKEEIKRDFFSQNGKFRIYLVNIFFPLFSISKNNFLFFRLKICLTT